jgi:hypothetical protein
MALMLDSITLPTDLIWIDEYAYSPVKQSINTAVNGGLIIEAAAALAGRPITLQGGDDYAWASKATLELLRLKQATPGLVMSLGLLGVTYSVIFAQPGITAKQVIDYSNPASEDWYAVTLKFIEL